MSTVTFLGDLKSTWKDIVKVGCPTVRGQKENRLAWREVVSSMDTSFSMMVLYIVQYEFTNSQFGPRTFFEAYIPLKRTATCNSSTFHVNWNVTLTHWSSIHTKWGTFDYNRRGILTPFSEREFIRSPLFFCFFSCLQFSLLVSCPFHLYSRRSQSASVVGPNINFLSTVFTVYKNSCFCPTLTWNPIKLDPISTELHSKGLKF